MSGSQSLGQRGISTGKAIRGRKHASLSRPASKLPSTTENIPSGDMNFIPRPAYENSRSRSSTLSAPSNIREEPEDVPAISTLSKTGRLVVGVDLGTTQKGIATMEIPYDKTTPTKLDPVRFTPKVYDMWLSRDEGGQKYPSTALYYEEGRQLPYTGNSLKVVSEEPGFDRGRVIKLLKLMFHHHKDDPTIKQTQKHVQMQLDREGKSADDALRDMARIILDELLAKRGKLSYLQQQYDHFAQLDLELVIAVPPGRSTLDHERVRSAFMQGPFNSANVYLESEPAAMFRSWVHEGENTRDWKVGKRYLIGDAGGGTCVYMTDLIVILQHTDFDKCFVRHRLEQLSPSLGFTQEYASESIAWGAETISDAFERLATRKVPDNCPGKQEEVASMRAKFDAASKMSFGIDAERKKPMSFAKMDWSQGHWQFSYDEIASCFDPCVNKLIEGLKAQLQDRPPIDCLVLGGGLASNPYVLNRLRKQFSQLQIRELGRDKKHVVVGAVLSRINDDFVVDHPIVRSKAVCTWISVTNKMKKSKLYKRLQIKEGRDGKDYFWGAIYLVKKGDQAANVRRNISSESSAEDARRIELDVKKENAKFSEEILTFNHIPGNDEWTAQCINDSWVDMLGNSIPSPEYSEVISWSPWAQTADHKVNFDDLEDGKPKGKGSVQPPFKIMRYSIEMSVTETTTRTWVKVWSSPEMERKSGNSFAFTSHPESQKPVFDSQSLSKSLAESFEFEAAPHQTLRMAEPEDHVLEESVPVVPSNSTADIEQPTDSLRVSSDKHNFQARNLVETLGAFSRTAAQSPILRLEPEQAIRHDDTVPAPPVIGISPSTIRRDRLRIAKSTLGRSTEGGVGLVRANKTPNILPTKNRQASLVNSVAAEQPPYQASNPGIASILNTRSNQDARPRINTKQKRTASATSGFRSSGTFSSVYTDDREIFHVATPPRKVQRLDDDAISNDGRLSVGTAGSSLDVRRSGRARTTRIPAENMIDWADLELE